MSFTRGQAVEFTLRYATAIIFVAIFLYFGLQAPRFLALDSVSNIVKQSAFIGIVAVGMTLCS